MQSERGMARILVRLTTIDRNGNVQKDRGMHNAGTASENAKWLLKLIDQLWMRDSVPLGVEMLPLDTILEAFKQHRFTNDLVAVWRGQGFPSSRLRDFAVASGKKFWELRVAVLANDQRKREKRAKELSSGAGNAAIPSHVVTGGNKSATTSKNTPTVLSKAASLAGSSSSSVASTVAPYQPIIPTKKKSAGRLYTIRFAYEKLGFHIAKGSTASCAPYSMRKKLKVASPLFPTIYSTQRPDGLPTPGDSLVAVAGQKLADLVPKELLAAGGGEEAARHLCDLLYDKGIELIRRSPRPVSLKFERSAMTASVTSTLATVPAAAMAAASSSESEPSLPISSQTAQHTTVLTTAAATGPTPTAATGTPAVATVNATVVTEGGVAAGAATANAISTATPVSASSMLMVGPVVLSNKRPVIGVTGDSAATTVVAPPNAPVAAAASPTVPGLDIAGQPQTYSTSSGTLMPPDPLASNSSSNLNEESSTTTSRPPKAQKIG